MEVFLVSLFIGLAVTLIYLKLKNNNLNSEVENLGEILRREMSNTESHIQTSRAFELECESLKSKLSTLQETSLTPDNSIPKDLHLEKVLDLSAKLTDAQSGLEIMTKKFEESRGKQISERVRLGQTAENFAAFFSEFPYNRKNVKALFQPVDLICFEEDEVIFIDVKTGGAQLSKKQRKIRDNIKSGRCRFEVHRLDENGYTIKREE